LNIVDWKNQWATLAPSDLIHQEANAYSTAFPFPAA